MLVAGLGAVESAISNFIYPIAIENSTRSIILRKSITDLFLLYLHNQDNGERLPS